MVLDRSAFQPPQTPPFPVLFRIFFSVQFQSSLRAMANNLRDCTYCMRPLICIATKQHNWLKEVKWFKIKIFKRMKRTSPWQVETATVDIG